MYLEIIQDVKRHDAGLLTLIIVLSVLGALLEAFSLALLAPLIVIMTNTPPESLKWPLDALMSAAGTIPYSYAVLWFAGAVSIAMVMRFATVSANYWQIEEVEVRLVKRLRLACLDVLFYGPQSFIDGYDNARTVQHFNEQSMRAGEALRLLLRSMTPIVTFALNVGLLMWLSAILTLGSLGLLLILAIGLTWVPKKIGANAQRFVDAMFIYNVKIVDLINGIKTVRSFATYNKERMQTVFLLDQQLEAQKKKILFTGITVPLFEVVGYVALCAILIGSVFVVRQENWLALAGPFFIILARSIPQAATVNNLRSLGSLVGADYAAVRTFLQLGQSNRAGSERISEKVRSIEFDDVGFFYEAGDEVLAGVDLKVDRGSWVLLTGASGAGKSTFLSLIVGLYSPTAGEITVNGRNLATVELQGWREHIGVIEQNPFIFNDSIRNNVAYRDKAVSDNDIWEALEATELAEFVRKLPAGLETELGDNGQRLSGGQRQRLAFARALCHRPDILILDEPTSALDQGTEAQVLRSIRNRYPEHTVIAVSHSKAFQELFDCVYRLEGGKIVKDEPIKGELRDCQTSNS